MEIKGKVHCFFEQSGTFKKEFIKLGFQAEDYDIQNNFGETDHVIDLFSEIEKAYDSQLSVFDQIRGGQGGDLVFAFFPCIYFCAMSQLLFSFSKDQMNYRGMDIHQRTDAILERSHNREKFYNILIKLVSVAMDRNIRLIIENPWTPPQYLESNFVLKPTIIDKNRMLRGDYYKKPTAYWFVNCEPTRGLTEQHDKSQKIIKESKKGSEAGVCSEDRSMISPDYARNFICDFIIGKIQVGSQMSLFDYAL